MMIVLYLLLLFYKTIYSDENWAKLTAKYNNPYLFESTLMHHVQFISKAKDSVMIWLTAAETWLGSWCKYDDEYHINPQDLEVWVWHSLSKINK